MEICRISGRILNRQQGIIRCWLKIKQAHEKLRATFIIIFVFFIFIFFTHNFFWLKCEKHFGAAAMVLKSSTVITSCQPDRINIMSKNIIQVKTQIQKKHTYKSPNTKTTHVRQNWRYRSKGNSKYKLKRAR